MDSFRIIIIGVTHHNTVSMIRSFAGNGCELGLILCEDKNSYVTKSCYIDWHVLAPSNDDVIYYLNNYCGDSIKTIVISCSDTITEFLDSNRAQLNPEIIVFNAGRPGHISKLMNKQIQIEVATRHGFKIPESLVIDENRIIPDNFSAFPCIIKPVKSSVGGKHIVVCNNKNDLHIALKKFPLNIKVQIQQFIEKKHEIVIPGVSVSGEVLMPAYVLKHRENSGATTYSSVKKHTVETLELVKKIQKLIKDIGYQGLFGVEFIYDGTDFYFIEVNLRNDATCYSICSAGINLPNIYVRLLTGRFLEMNPNLAEINSMAEFNDFTFVLHGQISVFKWLHQLRCCKCKFYYDKNDRALFWSALKYWINNWTLKKAINECIKNIQS